MLKRLIESKISFSKKNIRKSKMTMGTTLSSPNRSGIPSKLSEVPRNSTTNCCLHQVLEIPGQTLWSVSKKGKENDCHGKPLTIFCLFRPFSGPGLGSIPWATSCWKSNAACSLVRAKAPSACVALVFQIPQRRSTVSGKCWRIAIHVQYGGNYSNCCKTSMSSPSRRLV